MYAHGHTYTLTYIHTYTHRSKTICACAYAGIATTTLTYPHTYTHTYIHTHIHTQVEDDLRVRIRRYRNDHTSGSCLIAEDDSTGQIVGFLDISLTLFDKTRSKFVVSLGPGTSLAGPDTERRPYCERVCVCHSV
jgi:hypothetical protein